MKHAQFRLGETVLGEVAKTGKNVYRPRCGRRWPLRRQRRRGFPQAVILHGRAADGRGQDHRRLCRLQEPPRRRLQRGRFRQAASSWPTSARSRSATSSRSSRPTSAAASSRSAGIAAEIQRTIIPKKLPQFPSLAIGAFTSPARGVSGDYYDVIRTREDRVVGVIGDVAGKGVSAALVMVMIRSILHLITNTNGTSPPCSTGSTGASRARSTWTTTRPWARRRQHRHRRARVRQRVAPAPARVPPGQRYGGDHRHKERAHRRRERSTTYQRKALRLSDGDIVVLYTDGIVEAMNEQGKQFGRKNLGQLIAQPQDLSPKDIVGRIKQRSIATFVGTLASTTIRPCSCSR